VGTEETPATLAICNNSMDRDFEQVGQLSQPIRAAACISFGKNINAKSVHLTSLYPTALTSTVIIGLFYVTMFVLSAKLCNI